MSLKDLKFQVTKEARPETDSKNIIPEEYRDFLDVFSKKNLGILFLHQKYDHIPLYKMLPQEFNKIKCYPELYLAKRFI